MRNSKSFLERIVSKTRRVLPVALLGLGGLLIGGCPAPQSELEEEPIPIVQTTDDGVPENIYIPPESGPGKFIGRRGEKYYFMPGKEIKVGDFLASNEVREDEKIYGFLRRAVEVNAGNNATEVITVSAKPQEAVKDGSLVFVSGPGKERFRSLDKNVEVLRWDYGFEDWRFASEIGFIGNVDCEGDVNVKARVVYEVRDHEVTEFEFSLKGGASAKTNVYAETYIVTREGVWDQEVFDETQFAYAQLGVLPMVVVFNEKSEFSAYAAVNGFSTLDADFDTSVEMEVGARYKRGEGWSPIVDPSLSANPALNGLCVSGLGGALARLSNLVSAKFYGWDGPTLRADLYGKARFYGEKCWESDELSGYRVELETGVEAPFSTGSNILNFWKTDDLFDGRVKWTFVENSPGFEEEYPGSRDLWGSAFDPTWGGLLPLGGGGDFDGGDFGGGDSGGGDDGGGDGGGGDRIALYESEINDDQANEFDLTAPRYIIYGTISDQDDVDKFITRGPEEYLYRYEGSHGRTFDSRWLVGGGVMYEISGPYDQETPFDYTICLEREDVYDGDPCH
ncbi:MAG: hypothetical protein ABH864_04340 [archaeon]